MTLKYILDYHKSSSHWDLYLATFSFWQKNYAVTCKDHTWSWVKSMLKLN